MKASSLFLVGIAFACGFLFGFSYHHIVDDAHAETTTAQGHAPRPEATDSQWQRFEARLKALEASRAQTGSAQQTSAVPEPPQQHAKASMTKREMTKLLLSLIHI